MTDRHLSVIGFIAGFTLITIAILARTAWGSAAPPVDDPGWLETYLSPASRVILGGLACRVVALLLAWARRRNGWMRRGWVGNVSATTISALGVFGGALVVGDGVDAALMAVGALTFGAGLGADPESAKWPKSDARAKATAAGTIEAPPEASA